MYPHERSLVKQLSDKPFALIGVNSDKDLDSIREIVKEKNITWRGFWNGPEGTSGPISTAWNVSGWPTIYVLDGEGKIRFKNVRGEAMDKALETLFAEMKLDVKITHDEEEGEGGSETPLPAAKEPVAKGKVLPATPLLPPKGGE
ncbi:MAG: TlpA family protein disulfide reductase [Planctomycetota bacterium]